MKAEQRILEEKEAQIVSEFFYKKKQAQKNILPLKRQEVEEVKEAMKAASGIERTIHSVRGHIVRLAKKEEKGEADSGGKQASSEELVKKIEKCLRKGVAALLREKEREIRDLKKLLSEQSKKTEFTEKERERAKKELKETVRLLKEINPVIDAVEHVHLAKIGGRRNHLSREELGVNVFSRVRS
jgi:hypothetical protein